MLPLAMGVALELPLFPGSSVSVVHVKRFEVALLLISKCSCHWCWTVIHCSYCCFLTQWFIKTMLKMQLQHRESQNCRLSEAGRITLYWPCFLCFSLSTFWLLSGKMCWDLWYKHVLLLLYSFSDISPINTNSQGVVILSDNVSALSPVV